VTKGPFFPKICQFLLTFTCYNGSLKGLSHEISRFFRRSCDKTSTVCWAGVKRCHRCPKIRRQNVHTSLKSRLDIANVLGKSPVKKRPHVAKQPAGRHKWVQKCCDKPSKFCFRKVWTWCHRAFWGGWMLCHKWQTVHLEGGVDEKYVDGSYRWTIVTIVNCHSKRFVGWTLSLGRNFAWSVCGWTDCQDTEQRGY
jgi:hypothetical protein